MGTTDQCRDIKQLNPIAQKACNLFLEECKKQGVQIFITETYRSQKRQNWLYEQGRSRPGQVVTWTKKSNHTGRMAWDIACSPPQALYDSKVLSKAGTIAKQLGITWGGLWSTPDAPHFEVTSKWQEPKKEEPEVTKKIKMQINGVIKQVEVIEKDGFNYAKLQDIKDHFIKVEYDSVKKLPIIEARA
ncbi:hypothetical protein CS063_00125 [Sporanaerobium hydrogeniformans]|uniref:Uncharacterized protein n=1 Tax=Sporanaerobium hydrogeniformans TaxID=3072179 RepID=A0AC61DGI3_9FIRM|nr:M15 family metallopeptidase [Sporanaerobium hydrogeniformans]PHV71923.1 hypothetical protein CS063_00125 [Sporanaerobium hydrogeniformans]